MPVKEIVGKTIGFGLVSLSLLASAVLVFVGPHPYNDYLNFWLGLILLAMGLGAGGLGALLVAGIIYDARLRQKEAEIHIAPRQGPPAVPPAWGMGDVGRPDAAELGTHQATVLSEDPAAGAGGVKIMSVRVSNIDGPLIVAFLLAWTVVALVLLAPR